ncbi:MAG: hypothetical protein KAS73_13220 [Candidatus Sabulitectum sp.]|nr:hypothetical protein [Candidatus Sabulitectum sp.]
MAEKLVCVPGVSTESPLAERLVCVPGVSTELDATRRTRDPVKSAVASKSAKRKKMTKRGEDGKSLHSLSTLLKDLSTLYCNRCRVGDLAAGITVNRFTEATPFQERVFELQNLYPVT